MATEAVLKEWGNSLGIIIPKEVVKEKNLKKGEKIGIEIIKYADLSEVFGSYKFKQSAQKLKDEAREGWF